MLHTLTLIFFFAILMGSPVVGLLVFSGVGMVAAWQQWRTPGHADAWTWTTTDRWLALSFMSIFLFKLLSVAWSEQPRLALSNAGWHLYFLFWPLVLMGLNRCRTTQAQADQAIAAGLIFVALWRLCFALTDWAPIDPGSANVGILAQLVMTIGTWNLLAVTRPGPHTGHRLHILAVPATLVILVLSTRRLELLGFMALSLAILVWRYRQHYSPLRAIVGTLIFMAFLAVLVALRWEKFAQGIMDVQHYMANSQDIPVSAKLTSWGARLEMWRVGWAAFMDHPWLGLSASARPSDLQIYGAPPPEIFGHRHFHMHLLQVLTEGGLLGLLLFVTTIGYSIRHMIIRPFQAQPEIALLALGLLGAYVMEGAVSATLIYDKPNALLVILSAWLWVRLRKDSAQKTKPPEGGLRQTMGV
jgi:O-antigen ligase